MKQVSKKRPKWLVISSVFALGAAFVALFVSVLLISLVMGKPSPATFLNFVGVATSIVLAAAFLVAGILMARSARYNKNSLFGSSLAIFGVAGYIVWMAYNGTMDLNFGWSALALALPFFVLTYFLLPAALITSVPVFILSTRSELKEGQTSPRARKRVIATTSVLIALLCVMGGAFAFKCIENQKISEELEEMFAATEAEQASKSSAVFLETQLSQRGFELENSFDVSRDTDSQGNTYYSFYYRSQPTGLSWNIREASEEEGSWHTAQLSIAFDTEDPLYGLDELVLVESGGDYEYANRIAHESPDKETYVIMVDRIDRNLLDSYTVSYINDIRAGHLSYDSPQKDASRTGNAGSTTR